MTSWKLTIIKIALKEGEALLQTLKKHLLKVFPKLEEIEELSLPSQILEEAYTPARGQYNSTKILFKLTESIQVKSERFLAITSVDLYAYGLNFVFGEAQFPGRFAIISLCRLKPEFYGEPDGELFSERVKKEVTHELGHTFGLTHCPNPKCVMHFSNSIADTDLKSNIFCDICWWKLKRSLEANLIS